MPGSREGGIKAAARNKEKYGEDFYRTIGAKGGANGRTGGFYGDRARARIAGAIGGSRSKKGKTGVENIGFYPYFVRFSSRLNNVTAEEFLGMYNLGMSQVDIGEQMGRSSSLVSLLLKQARKEGML